MNTKEPLTREDLRDLACCFGVVIVFAALSYVIGVGVTALMIRMAP